MLGGGSGSQEVGHHKKLPRQQSPAPERHFDPP